MHCFPPCASSCLKLFLPLLIYHHFVHAWQFNVTCDGIPYRCKAYAPQVHLHTATSPLACHSRILCAFTPPLEWRTRFYLRFFATWGMIFSGSAIGIFSRLWACRYVSLSLSLSLTVQACVPEVELTGMFFLLWFAHTAWDGDRLGRGKQCEWAVNEASSLPTAIFQSTSNERIAYVSMKKSPQYENHFCSFTCVVQPWVCAGPMGSTIDTLYIPHIAHCTYSLPLGCNRFSAKEKPQHNCNFETRNFVLFAPALRSHNQSHYSVFHAWI